MVRELRSEAESLRLPDDPRTAAGALALRHFGSTTMEVPACVNIAALALAFQERIEITQVTGGASHLVHATDLHAVPAEPPRLLRRPWLIEAAKPGEVLYLDTFALGGYQIDGTTYLVGLRSPDGVAAARWNPTWSGEDLNEGVSPDSSPLIDDIEGHHEWTRQAARFAVVFAVLLEAAGSPLARRDMTPGRSRQKGAEGRQGQRGDEVVRRVFLDAPAQAPAGAYGGRRASGSESPAVPVTVAVSGHLKRQPYGPKGSLRRWIYVTAYEARRWIAPAPLRLVVTTRPN
jgi:hypothetical protein